MVFFEDELGERRRHGDVLHEARRADEVEPDARILVARPYAPKTGYNAEGLFVRHVEPAQPDGERQPGRGRENAAAVTARQVYARYRDVDPLLRVRLDVVLHLDVVGVGRGRAGQEEGEADGRGVGDGRGLQGSRPDGRQGVEDVARGGHGHAVGAYFARGGESALGRDGDVVSRHDWDPPLADGEQLDHDRVVQVFGNLGLLTSKAARHVD